MPDVMRQYGLQLRAAIMHVRLRLYHTLSYLKATTFERELIVYSCNFQTYTRRCCANWSPS